MRGSGRPCHWKRERSKQSSQAQLPLSPPPPHPNPTVEQGSFVLTVLTSQCQGAPEPLIPLCVSQKQNERQRGKKAGCNHAQTAPLHQKNPRKQRINTQSSACVKRNRKQRINALSSACAERNRKQRINALNSACAERNRRRSSLRRAAARRGTESSGSMR